MALETIKCKCGKTFAAFSDGHQDKEWEKNKKEYLRFGCSVQMVESQDFRFENCKCVKTKEQFCEEQLKNQLNLFEKPNSND